MRVEQLFKLIPEEELEFLSAETQVDYQVKKLSGILTFKLIVFAMLNSQRMSLRIMEQLFSSASFRAFANTEQKVKYNSIRDRIATMNVTFFEKLYLTVYERFHKLLNEKDEVIKIDTTFVSASAKLVDWSLRKGGSKDTMRQVKYGVALKGTLPCSVKIFTEAKAASDDVAIPQTIHASLSGADGIVTFDRGVQSRKEFEKLTAKGILFVGRLKTSANTKIIKSDPIPNSSQQDSSLTILTDEQVLLRADKAKWTTKNFRVIKATIKKNNQPIWFITNISTLSVYEIAAIYKRRWEIEVFFKFLKQHLNVTHLVSRNQNGMSVMLYITMIVSILLLAYKKLNRISTYKMAKLRFEIELDNMLLKEIVLLCGGDPNKASHLWNSS